VTVGSRILPAKVAHRDGEQVVLHAAVPGEDPEQPLGMVQIGRADGRAWMASTGSGWIDQDLPTLHDAVDWVVTNATTPPPMTATRDQRDPLLRDDPDVPDDVPDDTP